MDKTEFKRWLLSQLSDEQLRGRVSRALTDQPKSAEQHAPETAESAESDAFEHRYSAHDYEPDGFWLAQIREIERREYRPRGLPEEGQQIVRESEALFEHLCNFANPYGYCRLHAGEVPSEVQARFEGVFLSAMMMRQLHSFARTTVKRAFMPDQPFEAAQSYRIFFSHMFSERGAEDILRFSERYIDRLPEPTPQTYAALGYTGTGLPMLWWDEDGALREAHSMTKKEIARLAVEPPRRTFVWAITPLRWRVISLYQHACDAMERALANRDIIWRNLKTKRYLAEAAAGRGERNLSGMMRRILRLCEASVRSGLPDFPALEVKEELALLRHRLPAAFFNILMQTLRSEEQPPLSLEELQAIDRDTRYGKRVAATWIAETHPTEEAIVALFDVLAPKTVLGILKGRDQAVPDAIGPLKAFLLIHQGKKLTTRQQALVDAHIHPSYRAAYEGWCGVTDLAGHVKAMLLRFSEVDGFKAYWKAQRPKYRALRSSCWASVLTLALPFFARPKPKRITLDRGQIARSRRALAETVERLDAFMADAESSSSAGIAIEPADCSEALPMRVTEPERRPLPASAFASAERAFLRALFEAVSAGVDLDAGTATRIAASAERTPNLLVAAINDRAYDDIGAELIVFEGGGWRCDPFDLDWVEAEIGKEGCDDGTSSE